MPKYGANTEGFELGFQTKLSTQFLLAEKMKSRIAHKFEHLPPEAADLTLYLASSIFALLTFLISKIALYRWWGEMAALPYFLASVVSAWTILHPPRKRGATRLVIASMVFLTAVLIPLLAQIVDQAGSQGTIAHAQPEVLVIAAAGSRLVKGKALYPVISVARTGIGIPSSVPATNAFFPYLPGMALFGIASALIRTPAALGDPRIGFMLITLIATGLAIAWRPKTERSPMLAFQAMAILPTAALPLVTGGDDIPVVALMALGIVLLARQRWGWSGIVLGAAAILKFTSWPLVLIAGIVLTVRNGWKVGLKFALPALTIMIWTLEGEILHNLSALVNNVIKFPAGIASLGSPAASPLPGHILAGLWKGYPYIAVAIGLAVGAVTLIWIIYRTPKVHTGASWISALVLFIAILIAPATRVGYLLYPVDLAAWAWVLTTNSDSPGPFSGRKLYRPRNLLSRIALPVVSTGPRTGSDANTFRFASADTDTRKISDPNS